MLNHFENKCECKQGYKENDKGECYRCYMYLGECVSVCPVNTRIDGKLFICEA